MKNLLSCSAVRSNIIRARSIFLAACMLIGANLTAHGQKTLRAPIDAVSGGGGESRILMHYIIAAVGLGCVGALLGVFWFLRKRREPQDREYLARITRI